MANIPDLTAEIKLVKGIKHVLLLDSEQREFIAQVESDLECETGIENVGVKQALRRTLVFVATHTGDFRTPHKEIVRGRKILCTGFPELNKGGIDAIISSPCKEVHEYLSAFIKIDGEGEEQDATLLIGITI